MGCTRLCTQRGVTIAGSRSLRYRSISKLADPEPMMTAAWRTVVGPPEPSSTRPTSARDARCGESRWPSGTMPPRYTMRPTPAFAAAAPTDLAAARSTSTKSGRVSE